MFKELFPLAKDAPLSMHITAEDDKLRVTVQQKDDADAPLSLTVLATPEELDAELPGAIAQAVGRADEPKSVGEQVKEQIERTAAASNKPAKKKPAPAAAAPKKPATAAPKQPAKAANGKPGKAECLADLAAMQAKHGDKLKRDLFMKEAPTGRRFENLWGSWTKFLAAAERAAKKNPPAGPPAGDPPPTGETTANSAAPNGDTKTMPPPLDAGAGTSEHAAPQAPDGASPGAAADNPASTTAAAEVSKPADAAGTGNTEHAAPQAPYAPHLSSPGPTETPDSTNGAQPAVAAAPKTRTIKTLDGTLLAGGRTDDPAPGTELEIEGHGKVRVRTSNDDSIFVERVPLPVVRRLIDDDALSIGTYEGDCKAGDTIRAYGKTYNVLTANAKMIVVEKAVAVEEQTA